MTTLRLVRRLAADVGTLHRCALSLTGYASVDDDATTVEQGQRMQRPARGSVDRAGAGALGCCSSGGRGCDGRARAEIKATRAERRAARQRWLTYRLATRVRRSSGNAKVLEDRPWSTSSSAPPRCPGRRVSGGVTPGSMCIERSRQSVGGGEYRRNLDDGNHFSSRRWSSRNCPPVLDRSRCSP